MQLQHESMSSEHSEPPSGHVTTSICATWGLRVRAGCPHQPDIFLARNASQWIIFTVFFMTGKLFLFVFKETNLSLFF